MRFVILLFLVFISTKSIGQIYDSSFKQDEVLLGYDNRKTIFYFNPKNEIKQFCFYDNFDDSISVAINNKIFNSKYIKTRKFSGYGGAIIYKKCKRNRSYYAKIIVYKKKPL